MEEENDINKQNDKISIKEFFTSSFWVLSIYFKTFPLPAVFTTIFYIFDSFKALFLSFITYKIIDKIILIKDGINKFESIYLYLILFFIFLFLEIVIGAIKVYADWKIGQSNYSIFEEMIFSHLTKMSVFQIESPEVNNKMSIVRQFLQNVLYYVEMVIILISNIVLFLFSLSLIISIIPQVLPFLAIFGILRFFIEKKFIKKTFKVIMDNSEHERVAYMGSYYLTRPRLLAEVKVSNVFKNLKDKYINFFNNYYKSLFKIVKKRVLVVHSFDFISSLIYISSYIFLIFNFLKSTIITIGNLTFQFGILRSFLNSFENALGEIIRIGDRVIKNREVYNFFHIKPENQEHKITELPKLESPLDINIENISFKYPNSENYIYKNFNLKIKAGEKIAIVGENGAGKTTLSKLITGMYEVNAGNIFMGDYDIKNIVPETLFRNFGILFQDYNFYSHLSVKDNVTISSDKKRHNNEDIIECLKASQAWNFVLEYKNGLDQILSETITNGINPSTGQKQKIAIARFFYQNAPFVIFDEPTSSIDAVAEYNILNHIYKFFKNRTVIIISHRFSTIKNADRIIVIDKGKIVEQGSHTELMKLNGMYAKSFKLQASSYN